MLKKTIDRVKDSIPTTRQRTVAEMERDARQLTRLERLMDFLFALLIWGVFQNLPIPSIEEFAKHSNSELIDAYKNSFIIILVGAFLIITYWGQNNRVFGNLVRTDGKHAVFSLMQMFFLMLYMYSVSFEMVFSGETIALVAQSITLALSGFMAVIAWGYARKNRRLLSDAISNSEAEQLKISIFAEPLAATFTIPFAFIGPGAWNLSWLSLILFSIWLKRRSRKKTLASSPSE